MDGFLKKHLTKTQGGRAGKRFGVSQTLD
eukprot:COSAG02_NODE_29103_length_576_cov_0.798742_1_plen_28_part_01